jgi:hypothetical protein
MNNTRGVRDLMEQGRYKSKHIAKAMVDAGIPGNWGSHQNVYNLIDGKVVPKDAYIYVVLADLFGTDVQTILMRYTNVTLKSPSGKKIEFSGDAVDWEY